MALTRYVLTATVTLTPDVLAAATAGEPGTGGAAGFGNEATAATATAGKFGLWGMTLLEGTAIYADPTALGTTGPCLLYQAIGASNLAPWTDGTSNVGHAALSN